MKTNKPPIHQAPSPPPSTLPEENQRHSKNNDANNATSSRLTPHTVLAHILLNREKPLRCEKSLYSIKRYFHLNEIKHKNSK